jgi:ribosomal protein S18 acetylase RimI-like enzyme
MLFTPSSSTVACSDRDSLRLSSSIFKFEHNFTKSVSPSEPFTMSIRVERVQDHHLEQVCDVQNLFLSSKHCCCCISLGGWEKKSDMEKMYAKTPDKMNVAAVALDGETVVGFMQCVLHGMPCDLHTPKVGECYVATLAVMPGHRGKGIGTKLLQWGEDLANERKCTSYTLAVINGNPARRLYDRWGFVPKKIDTVDACFTAAFVCCLLGRPYGYCHAEWGVTEMEKPLTVGQMEIER